MKATGSCLCGLHCYTSQALTHINEAVEESCELVAAFALHLRNLLPNQKTDIMSQERGVVRRIQKVNAEEKNSDHRRAVIPKQT